MTFRNEQTKKVLQERIRLEILRDEWFAMEIVQSGREAIWTTKEGKKLTVKNMSSLDLEDTIQSLLKRIEVKEVDKALRAFALVMRNELNDRK